MWFHSLSQLLPSNGVCKSNNKVWTATSLWLLRGGCWHCGCAVCNVHVAMANPKIVGARALLFELIHHLLPRCGNDSRKLWPKSVDIIPRWRDIIMAHSRLVHKLAPPVVYVCLTGSCAARLLHRTLSLFPYQNIDWTQSKLIPNRSIVSVLMQKCENGEILKAAACV